MSKDNTKTQGPPGPRILVLDIENSPQEVLHFGKLWNTNIQPDNVVHPSYLMCFAAKFHGEDKVYFYSMFHDGQQKMLECLWALVNETDILVTFNGKKHDYPHINREFLEAGMPPPSPIRHVDIIETMRRVFLFESNSLNYLSKRLNIGRKIAHAGMELWVACMKGDKKAWALMKRYNKQDVLLTDELYDMIKAWVPNHPSIAHDHEPGQILCPTCRSEDLRREGYALTQQGKFQRYQCRACNRWSRGTSRVNVGGAGIAPIAT